MFEKLKYKLTRYKPRDEKEGIDNNALINDEIHRSKRYHEYFEGYVERYVWDMQKGKNVIERSYVEDYYYRDLEKKPYVLNKLLYFALFAASLLLFVWAGAQLVLPKYKYVYIPSLFVVIMEVLMVWAMISFAMMPRKMTIYEYSSGSRRLMKYSLITAAAMAVQGLVMLIYVLFFPAEGSLWAKLIAVLGNMLGAGCTLLLYALEEKAEYVRVENENSYLKHAIGTHLIR